MVDSRTEPSVAQRRLDPSGLMIRATRVADYEAVAAIAAMPGVRAGTLRLPFRSPDETRKFIEAHGENDLQLVAELDGAIVGMAGWVRFKGRRSHAAGIGMGVADDHTGRGIGTALLAALTDAADRWYGIRRLELTVFTTNAAAIRLYRRFGFEEEGTLREHALADGRYRDALAMARLGPVL